MFEQRAAEQADRHMQPRFPMMKRQSNGSTGSGCSSAREARRTAPELQQSDAPSGATVSTFAAVASPGMVSRKVPPVAAVMPNIAQGPAPKVSLQDLLRQDEAGKMSGGEW